MSGVDFKPSDVILVGIPLTGTMGRAEAEAMATLLVRTCQVQGNAWQNVEPRAIGEVIQADLAAEREPLHSLNRNPFFRPDPHELVRRGFAEWAGGEGKSLRFTPAGLERLRKWVRS